MKVTGCEIAADPKGGSPEDKDPGKWADNIRRKHNI